MGISNTAASFQKLMDDGQALYDKGQYKDAIKTYKTALIMYKDIGNSLLAGAYVKLANAYYKLEDRDKSTFYYEEYLKLFPEGQTSVFSRLGHSYYYLDSDKSIDYHNKALNMQINLYDSACKLFSMIKSAFYEQQDIKDESEYEVEQIKNNLLTDIKKYNHSSKKQNPNKKLTIGYFSSDCHAHTVMNYMIPIWQNHNKDEFNVYLFNCSDKHDTVTDQIMKLMDKTIDCSKLSTSQLAKVIYDNNVDILVELSGYTHLKVYCTLYKPAPVIISYLGYLNTMGIKEIDYIIADKYTIPEDKAYLYTEKPMYLDKGYQIFREKNVPDVEQSPFKKNGYITFGSFNCTSKLNDTTFYMWAELLKAVPNSKLLVYRTRLTKKIAKYIQSKIEKFGISEDRMIFSSKRYNPHYRAYSLADISLDSYPFSGMSIAIETALMGVPTVTLVGEGMQSRGAGRINNILGLDDLNALSGSEYVNIAVKLANDTARLENLRENMRSKVYNSALKQDAAEFTKNLEEKYKQAWQDFINSP